MPEEAFMEFPPGLRERSRRWTIRPWERSWEEALRPARPAPTTIAVFPGAAVVDMVVDIADLVIWEAGEVRWRQSIDERAMKSEMVRMRRMRLRLINLLVLCFSVWDVGGGVPFYELCQVFIVDVYEWIDLSRYSSTDISRIR